jgi:hypothetical protein
MNIEFSPIGIADLDCFKDRRRHGEYAGVPARDDCDLPAFGGECEGVTCPADLDTIAGGVTALIQVGLRDSIEIGPVANQIRRGLKGSGRRRRQKIDGSGSKTDDDKRAAHSRLPCPGISTIEK